MDIQFTGRHFQLDDQIKSFAAGKLGKLDKFLEEPVDAQLTLETEKHRQIAELHVSHRYGTVTATEEAGQMLEAIQAVIEKVEKQARRSRKKHKDKKRRADRSEDGRHWPLEVVDRDSLRAGSVPRVIKTTRLPIKPMTIEEAALGLDESKNEFFVFLDSGNDKVSVLYRRTDGHYGLIAPEF